MNTKFFFLGIFGLMVVACANPAEKDGGGAKPASADSTAASSTDKQEATSQERYRTGDDLFVFAKSGLTLRKTPDKEGEKVSTLPFGSKSMWSMQTWNPIPTPPRNPVVSR